MVNKNYPYVSIIIPLFNKETTIKKTIESVLNQSYYNYEIVVVNDGSTDRSESIVRSIRDERIRLVSKHNEGVSSARNMGIINAKGSWILFLDADDIMLPNALKLLTDNIVNDTTIVAANFLVKTDKDLIKALPLKKKYLYEDKKSIFRAWCIKRLFLRAGSFIVPAKIAKDELFDINYSRFEDLDFILRILQHVRILLLPNEVMIYQTAFAEASNVTQEKWNNDYLFYLTFEPHQFWRNCVLGGYLYLSIRSYPEKKNLLLDKYRDNLKYAKFSRFLYYYSQIRFLNIKKIKNKLRKLILHDKKNIQTYIFEK